MPRSRRMRREICVLLPADKNDDGAPFQVRVRTYADETTGFLLELIQERYLPFPSRPFALRNTQTGGTKLPWNVSPPRGTFALVQHPRSHAIKQSSKDYAAQRAERPTGWRRKRNQRGYLQPPRTMLPPDTKDTTSIPTIPRAAIAPLTTTTNEIPPRPSQKNEGPAPAPPQSNELPATATGSMLKQGQALSTPPRGMNALETLMHRPIPHAEADLPSTTKKRIYDIDMYPECFDRLRRPGGWLNDASVAAIAKFINFDLPSRATTTDTRLLLADTYMVGPYLVEKLLGRNPNLGSYNYAEVETWLNRTDDIHIHRGRRSALAYKRIIIPAHLPNHWTLAFIDVANKSISYMDSCTGYEEYERDLTTGLLRWYGRATGTDTEAWTKRNSTVSRQDNTCDCGVFTCLAALSTALGRPDIVFQPEDITAARSFLTDIILKESDKIPIAPAPPTPQTMGPANLLNTNERANHYLALEGKIKMNAPGTNNMCQHYSVVMAATLTEYDATKTANMLTKSAGALREAVLRGYNHINAIYGSRDASRIWAVEKLFAGGCVAAPVVQTRISEIIRAPTTWEGNVVDLHLISSLTKLKIVMVNMYTHSDQFHASDELIRPRQYPCHTESRFTPLGYMSRTVELYKLPRHFEPIFPTGQVQRNLRLGAFPTADQMLTNLETHIALLARHKPAWDKPNNATLSELQTNPTEPTADHVDLTGGKTDMKSTHPAEDFVDMADTSCSEVEAEPSPPVTHGDKAQRVTRTISKATASKESTTSAEHPQPSQKTKALTRSASKASVSMEDATSVEHPQPSQKIKALTRSASKASVSMEDATSVEHPQPSQKIKALTRSASKASVSREDATSVEHPQPSQKTKALTRSASKASVSMEDATSVEHPQPTLKALTRSASKASSLKGNASPTACATSTHEQQLKIATASTRKPELKPLKD
jgi:hypothetical protein